MARRKKPVEQDLDNSPIGNYVRPDFIASADIHMREDQPTCRTDEFLVAMDTKLKWLVKLQQRLGIPILDAGDLLAKARPSAWLLRYLIKNMPEDFHSVAGNHDLPEHSIDNIDKSGFGVLEAAGIVNDLAGEHKFLIDNFKFNVWGMPWKADPEVMQATDVLVWHIMTYAGDKPWPGCKDDDAKTILEKVPQQMVITGHNHVPFVVEHDDKILINPGSLFRTTAAQMHHNPRVYLCDVKNGGVKPVFLPITADVVTRDHIETTESKEERLSAFTSALGEDVEVGLNYKHNMELHFSENRVRGAVKRIILSEMGD